MVDAVGISVGWDRLASSAQGDYPNVQNIAIGAAAAQTIPFSSLATVVTLRATVNCWFSVGGTAAAHTAGSDYLPANTTWMLKIPQGAILSFIQDSTAGWVSVTPAVTVGPAPLLLDTVRLAAAAFALRRLTNLYTGACVRVRRTSDSAQQDIGFVGNNLDVTSFNGFVGPGGVGGVTTWYDQSGNGRNFIQNTPIAQPQLLPSDAVMGGKPSLLFLNNTGMPATVPATTLPLTLSAVIARTSASGFSDMMWFGSNQPDLYFANTANTLGAGNQGIDGLTSTGTDGVGHTLGGIFNTASSFIYTDGAAIAGSLSAHSGATTLTVGHVTVANNCRISEAIYWPSNLGATLGTVQANQKAYWGTP